MTKHKPLLIALLAIVLAAVVIALWNWSLEPVHVRLFNPCAQPIGIR